MMKRDTQEFDGFAFISCISGVEKSKDVEFEKVSGQIQIPTNVAAFF